MQKVKNIVKLEILVIIQVNTEVLHICIQYMYFKIQNTVTFYSGSLYDYRVIIKEVVEEFVGKFFCLVKNTETYITFLVPIEKEVTSIGEDGEEITKPISCRLQFIYGALFMASSLSDLAKKIHKFNCKYGHDDKKYKTYEIKNKDCDYCLGNTRVKDTLIEYKCLCCNNNYQKKKIKT